MDIGSPTYLRYGVLVSILVLVERPFGLDDRHPDTRACSFNPCFGGEAIWTTAAGIRAGWSASFNPCFGGEAIWTTDGLCGV